MDIDKETQEKIQELSLIEQNIHNFSLQKQAFQIEQNEADSALREAETAKDDVYKIIGQVMLKADKKELINELKDKLNVLELRIKSIEKQEKFLREKSEKLKSDLEEKFRDKKK